MPPKTIQPIDIETSDLTLQKLGDIESLLTMRLQQAKNQGVDSKDDLELVQQLLVKVAKSVDGIKSMKLTLEGVETVTLQGKPGEPGKDCDPIEVAAILKESEDFLALVKGEKGDSVKGDPGEPGKPGENGKTPKKGEDYMTDAEKKEMTDDVIESVKVELPSQVKKAVKEYMSAEEVTAKVNETIKKKNIKVSDVQGLAEMFKAEIDKIYENVSTYARKSGGGSLLLAALQDIDFDGMQVGSVLKYNGKRFYFGSNDTDEVEVFEDYQAENANTFLVVRNPVTIYLPQIDPKNKVKIVISNQSNGEVTVVPKDGELVHDDTSLIISNHNSTAQLQSSSSLGWIIV